jgi:hypothetical protein
MNDTIRLAAERAVGRFGGSDGLFNAACFSWAFTRIAGTCSAIDGNLVRAMLTGRRDIEVLKGGCHFRLVEA